MDDELASTNMMLQLGQMAETMSRSREISSAQPPLAVGYEPATPDWFSLVYDTVGRPNWPRYVARSLAALGSS